MIAKLTSKRVAEILAVQEPALAQRAGLAAEDVVWLAFNPRHFALVCKGVQALGSPRAFVLDVDARVKAGNLLVTEHRIDYYLEPRAECPPDPPPEEPEDPGFNPPRDWSPEVENE